MSNNKISTTLMINFGDSSHQIWKDSNHIKLHTIVEDWQDGKWYEITVEGELTCGEFTPVTDEVESKSPDEKIRDADYHDRILNHDRLHEDISDIISIARTGHTSARTEVRKILEKLARHNVDYGQLVGKANEAHKIRKALGL